MKFLTGNKKMKAIFIYALISVLVFVLAFVPVYTYTYWGGAGVGGADNDGAALMQIGEWRESNPGEDPFDNIVDSIVAQDPALKSGAKQIRILGDYGPNTTPDFSKPDVNQYPIAVGDVLVWRRDGKVIAAQLVTSSVGLTDIDTWAEIDSALGVANGFNEAKSTNYNVPGNYDKVYDASKVYTTAHAPVWYNGNWWLARREVSGVAPAIGNDWFQYNESYEWVAQSYPAGSCVKVYNSTLGDYLYYRSTVDTTAADAPGADPDKWQGFSILEDDERVADWRPGMPTTGINDEKFPKPDGNGLYTAVDGDGNLILSGNVTIVRYEGEYYLAETTMPSSNTTPDVDEDNWSLILPWNSSPAVPAYNGNSGSYMPYAPGSGNALYDIGNGEKLSSFVQDNGLYYLKNSTNTGEPGSTTQEGFVRVFDWAEISGGIGQWSSTFDYHNSYEGLLVEYEGYFYQKGNYAPKGEAPDGSQFWHRVLRFDETQAPVHWSEDDFDAGEIVEYNGQYYAARQNVGSWAAITSNQWSPVPEYNSATTYAQADGSGGGWGSNPFACFTEENGVKTFWRAVGGGTFTGNQHVPGVSTVWEKIEFICTESIIVTVVNGKNIVWTRNNTTPTTERPGRHSTVWTEYVVTVAETYVYTEENGAVALWEKTVAGSTAEQPGTGSDWAAVTFAEGAEHAYIVNNAGLVRFWHSASKSLNLPTSDHREWIELNGIKQEYVVVLQGNVPHFFHTAYEQGQSETTTWFEYSNAWIGNPVVRAGINSSPVDSMISDWSERNAYTVGDLVVFGSTATGMYRYFRYKYTGPASDAYDINPMDTRGVQYWEPVNMLV